MVYVCNKVGLLFPYCEKCEEYKACEELAKKSELIVEDQAPIVATA